MQPDPDAPRFVRHEFDPADWLPDGPTDDAWQQLRLRVSLWQLRGEQVHDRRRVLIRSDPFDESKFGPADRARFLELLRASDRLDWVVATPQPDRVDPLLREAGADRFPANLMLGVPLATQREAEARIFGLLGTPATRRFAWVAPREPIDLLEYLEDLDWVIASGPEADALPWLRRLRDDCRLADVAFWFLGWGDRPDADRILDGRTWDEAPYWYARWGPACKPGEDLHLTREELWR